MASGEKRSRGPKWSHEETLVLAELKREASLTKNEGKLVWIEIAQTISNRFPDQTKSHDQCRRRWETLIKVYNRVQKYCLEKGKTHSMLNEGELSSMELDTAYRRDWYDVVEHVCSLRKRKEKPQSDSMVVKRSKISESISTQPSSEGEKLNLEEEVRLLMGQIECLNSEVAQLREAPQQHQISSQPRSEDEKLSLEEEVRLLRGRIECSNSEVAQENRWLRGQIERLNSEVGQLRHAPQQHQVEHRWEDFDPSDSWMDQAIMDPFSQTLDSTSVTQENGIRNYDKKRGRNPVLGMFKGGSDEVCEVSSGLSVGLREWSYHFGASLGVFLERVRHQRHISQEIRTFSEFLVGQKRPISSQVRLHQCGTCLLIRQARVEVVLKGRNLLLILSKR